MQNGRGMCSALVHVGAHVILTNDLVKANRCHGILVRHLQPHNGLLWLGHGDYCWCLLAAAKLVAGGGEFLGLGKRGVCVCLVFCNSKKGRGGSTARPLDLAS